MNTTAFYRIHQAAVAGPTPANYLQSYIYPITKTLIVVASLVATLALVISGLQYITSSGRPDKLEHAKHVIKNALIGLAIVLAASTLTSLLLHAYHSPAADYSHNLPSLTAVQPDSASLSLVDVLIKAVNGLLLNLIQTAGQPFIKALAYFTGGTPLIATNASVVKLWLIMVSMADTLFVLVVMALGFHVMSFSSLGLEEMNLKQLLPRLGLGFLLINSSLYAIDGLISFSNVLIHALTVSLPIHSVWDSLSAIAKQASGLGLAALLVMVMFLILSVILLVYYVGRLVTLYVGVVLAPLVALLWLLPAFRDFALTALKTYLATIFVLFVHVVILLLAGSLFEGLKVVGPNQATDPIMTLILGLATLIALLKTQGVLMQLSYVSVGPKTARRLSQQLIHSVSYIGSKTSGFGHSSGNRTVEHHYIDKSLRRPAALAYAPVKPAPAKANFYGKDER